MYKILITGASGFIGTNLLQHFLDENYDVLNLDIAIPRNKSQFEYWKKVDITDWVAFKDEVLFFEPDYIIHLAARTDLEGKTLDDYSANTVGVYNLMKIISDLPNLKKVIIASSKFVTTNGYIIKDQFDYCPHTVYGKSKVITEKIVWENQPHCDWCIIRPTSIWGPWFEEPYRNFFDIIIKRMYFHIGNKPCFKTYGFIGNSIYQINELLNANTSNDINRVFYIGDEPAYEINEWADEIALEMGFKNIRLPYSFVWSLAKLGDFLRFFNVKFPIQSFRLENMTNNGVNDLTNTTKIAPEIKYSRIKGNRIVLKWLKENRNDNK